MPTYIHYNLRKENTLCKKTLRANIMILFREKLQFMNGEVRINIPVMKMPENQQAPLFLQRQRKIEATLAK
jgi:hypothetical protein